MRIYISKPDDVEGKLNKWIEFRDSYSLFGVALKYVTKDFCTTSFKSKIDHNKINLVVDYLSTLPECGGLKWYYE